MQPAKLNVLGSTQSPAPVVSVERPAPVDLEEQGGVRKKSAVPPAQGGEPARASNRRRKPSTTHRKKSAPARDDGETEALDVVTNAERIKLRPQLRKRERIIQRGLNAWQAVATAFIEIRNLKLYRAEGYTDFGQYCRERLGLGKSTVNRQIGTGEVYNVLASTGAKLLPTSERQMRPLLRLRQPKQEPTIWGAKVAKVWAKVVHDAELNRTPITEKQVIVARKQLGFDPQPKESQPEPDLEKRWARLEALLEHEREFWPVGRRRELRVRIIGVVSGWEDGKERRSELDEAPAPKVIGITVEQEQAREAEPDDDPAQPAEQVVAHPSLSPAPPAEVPVPKSKRGQAAAKENAEVGEQPEDADDPDDADERHPDGPTVEEVLNEVVGHLQGISEECEDQRDNLPENMQGTQKEDDLSEMAEATQRIGEDLEEVISNLGENEDDGDDEDGDELDRERSRISEMRIKPPRFIQGSRPKRISRLIEIIEAVATAVKPRTAEGAEELEALAGELSNV